MQYNIKRIARKEKITTRLSFDPTTNSQNKLFMKCIADSEENFHPDFRVKGLNCRKCSSLMLKQNDFKIHNVFIASLGHHVVYRNILWPKEVGGGQRLEIKKGKGIDLRGEGALHIVHYDVQPSHSPLPSPSHQLSAQGEGGHDI